MNSRNNKNKQSYDKSNLYSSKPILLGKCSYTGHAITIYSVEQAISILDSLGHSLDSEDCLPFAISLVEAGEKISIAEDNGEFGSGEVLAACLDELDGYNVLICITREFHGIFVLDMYQQQKHRIFREAALQAIKKLQSTLTNKNIINSENDKLLIDINESSFDNNSNSKISLSQSSEHQSIKGKTSLKRNSQLPKLEMIGRKASTNVIN